MDTQYKITDYKIFGQHTRSELEAEIQTFLDLENGDGSWEPHGGVSTHGVGDRILCFCQVMIKKEFIPAPPI